MNITSMKISLVTLAIAAACAASSVDAQSAFPDQPVNATAAARSAAAGSNTVTLPRTGYTSLTPRQIPVPPRNTLVAGDQVVSIDAAGNVHRRELAANSKPKARRIRSY